MQKKREKKEEEKDNKEERKYKRLRHRLVWGNKKGERELQGFIPFVNVWL